LNHFVVYLFLYALVLLLWLAFVIFDIINFLAILSSGLYRGLVLNKPFH
jgi:hypothetical protein